TAIRLLTAVVAVVGGNSSYVLDGMPRMTERPIGDLVAGLKQLGADADCFLDTNCPPVRVNAKGGGLPGDKQIKLSGSVSGMFLTALLVAAPLAHGDVKIEIVDRLISVPFVEMTIKTMERVGVSVEHNADWDRFLIQGDQKYKSPGNAYVEGDASNASYFLAGAAVTGGTVTVKGCGTGSLQLRATVEEGPDYCVITPPEKLNITAIDTYNDHRIAMAFSLAACADVRITIKDPGCPP
uniref:Enolpyruvate transferase domain-containing protein n=1 Tax=Chenopodium quinoa TaxID=63459 RepID=A0A803MZV5_CHEQI